MRLTFEHVKRERVSGRGSHWDISAYGPYLESILPDLPSGAAAFINADCHYDIRDHKCLHDAWVESISVVEPAAGDRHRHRETGIIVKLLGAFHDGIAELRYKSVTSYLFECPDVAHGHGAWIIDEVRLSANRTVVHDVLLANAKWLIECADIEWTWTDRR
jgi:hypothetical protein